MPGRQARARATALPLALAALLTPTVTACGGTTTVNQSKVPEQRVDPALRALLPKDIRDKGSLTSAVGNDYPPLSLLDIDNKTVIGAEPDLIRAVGQILGLRVHLVQANFERFGRGTSRTLPPTPLQRLRAAARKHREESAR